LKTFRPFAVGQQKLVGLKVALGELVGLGCPVLGAESGLQRAVRTAEPLRLLSFGLREACVAEGVFVLMGEVRRRVGVGQRGGVQGNQF
jgi:hypothetical protein